ncbi:DUF2325 domain-containing protein [Lactobacillus paragasseri]|uniref:DUF2325 domain-containing protein n=1 Tax=Lactobacillus paragasseri TaxID=2107999 RepID=UPI0012E111D3|nr:DUF2325 domain-containing protein [Lactobacillus paragasseri]MDX5117888.1 DUF2325 domain-containing protein [Lactobacillus paragasseri]MDX5121769.1 DUF2325 domain-containing protein [Lactobacillus paragasseri]QGT97480.1 DUF2325 domain-containing protein [Lactobacillus paragasseri]UWI46641.1 DUF2325 domain-containing protein [Lactobacillus paragasseri]
MFDYRNNLKRILNNTAGDDKSLQNSLNAIKVVLGMTGEAESTSVNNKMDDKVIAQINTFLQGITTLIERPGDKNAKKIVLGALHKLTFDHNIATNFGKKLGLLDQAIQASEETSTAVNRKIFEDAVKPKKEKNRDYRKGRRYTVIRALKGADLINNNGEVVFEVNEGQIHDLNLKSGDIVEALPLANSLNEAEVLRVVGYRKLRGRDYDKIADFKYGVVQGSPGNLSVSRNIHGEKLVINHKPVIVALDSSYYQNGNIHLEDGAIVDLAWYTGDVRLKKDPASAVQVRWIYETEQPKRVSKTKKAKTKVVASTQVLAKLNMNLHYQRVGIAVGDNQNEAILEGIVNRYNGIPIPIDAFEGKKKVIESQIKDLDIVILVTAFAAHDSTWNISEFASKYHVKFTVSSSKGYQAFERALYRAENGMPAYEGNQQLEYKMLKNN